jgi:hypothetical protein
MLAWATADDDLDYSSGDEIDYPPAPAPLPHRTGTINRSKTHQRGSSAPVPIVGMTTLFTQNRSRKPFFAYIHGGI